MPRPSENKAARDALLIDNLASLCLNRKADAPRRGQQCNCFGIWQSRIAGKNIAKTGPWPTSHADEPQFGETRNDRRQAMVKRTDSPDRGFPDGAPCLVILAGKPSRKGRIVRLDGDDPEGDSQMVKVELDGKFLDVPRSAVRVVE